MARLKEYNGHYCESEYEYAFIGFLEAEGWIYSSGNSISRVTKRDVLIADDFKNFISDTNSELIEDEVTQIFDNVRLVGSESDFATLHKVYGWMVDGVQFTPQDGLARMIPLIDFENWDKNIFRVVNQFTVEYTNNGQKENRRPDVLLFVNGMPLCVIELKNPADANATIYDAWEQINIRYWRDIPHLLHYCPLACISDGVKTRLGTVRTPYEHFYAWRRVNDGDTISTLPFEENAIDDYVLYNKQDDFLDSINFTKNKLFKIYFPQYCNWKNDAIETVATLNRFNRSQMLFSLDVKSFYYSVFWKFDLLDDKMGDDERYKALKFLNLIIQRIFEKYTGIVNEYRILEQCIENKEYILPIGLFSSMLLANVYMYELDNYISQNPNVLHYGRYVDDIILVVDVTGDEKNISEDNAFDRYLVEKNNILVNVESGKYTINKYPNLYIQKEKVKIMYFNKTGSKTLINQLLKTITYPSQMNVIPDTELSLVDFEEAAYAKNGIGVETKIRDIGQLEIDRFQLGWHMSQIVMNNRVRKKYVTREEKVRRQNESDSILRFFQGVKALEYSSNWINAMYYFMLTSDTNRYAWKQFQGNIIDAIKQIKVSDIEDVKRNKKRRISSKLKKDLALHFDICISTVLALNIQYCRKEKKTVLALAKKMRKANLFNHHLVSYPLINYSDDIDENCDLTNILPEQIHSMNLLIRDSKKSKLSPRFINLDEIYQYVFLRKFCNGGNYYGDEDNTVVKKKLEFIENYFYEVNQINRGTASHLAITIKNEMHNEYILQKIELGNKCAVKEKIKIAIANIKLDTKRCCLGLACGDDVEIDRLRLIDFMYRAYANGKNDKVDFLVFPEFYMPLQWISDVLAFVRKSGITVVSGLQYVTSGHQAYNNVAIFAPVNTGRYTSSVLFAREKNDYAPMERQILALEKYICVDQEKPVYQMINNRGIDYGLFLCYEFTDIIARALYKDKVDIIFTPEHNRDTSYFSNIIETTARDLHVFIVQANTSIYGDSRITGPFGRNDRNVLQIKGGDKDDIIIGTIELGKVKKYQQDEKVDFDNKIQEYLKYNRKQKYEEEQKLFKEQKIKIAKTSARFGGNK